MSNIGKQPINIPDGVVLSIDNNLVSVKGKLGELSMEYNSIINIENTESGVVVKRPSDSRKNRELHGLYRALIANMVQGVTEGYSKELNNIY